MRASNTSDFFVRYIEEAARVYGEDLNGYI